MMNSKSKFNTKYLIQSAIIAALYAGLTIFLSPISYGAVQIRVSEALTVLPFFTPAAVPGLLVGCLLANLLSPYGIADIIIGSIASGIGAYGSYRLRAHKRLVPLPPVLSNGFLVGISMKYIYGLPMPLWACLLWVGVGEIIACYAIGYPLLTYLMKYRFVFDMGAGDYLAERKARGSKSLDRKKNRDETKES